MNIYSNDSAYNKEIIAFLKVFYPLEESHLSDYEQSTYRVTIGNQEVKIVYFCEGEEITQCRDISKEETLIGLVGRAYIKAMKSLIKGMLFDLCTEVTKKDNHWGTLMGIRPTKLAFKIYRATGDYEQTKEELMSRYRLSEDKASLLIEVIKTESPYLDVAPSDHSVYVGVPFCPSKCSYCTFTSFQSDQWQDAFNQYTDTLIMELEAGEKWLSKCHSIYIGGGTPTSLTESDFDRLIKKVRELIGDRDIEFTVEAGRPDSITTGKLQSMKKYGVNRIAINPQTMQNATLKKIGRKHDAEAVVACFNEARALGFKHINMDLILGLPGEDFEDVDDTLEKVVALNPESITVHTLAYKRGSKLSDQRSEEDLGDGIDQALMLVQRRMAEEGYLPYYLYRQKNMIGNYENVGYCRPGYESVYNIMIMEEITSIIGFGAGAISKRVDGGNIKRLEQAKDVKTYLEKIEKILEKKNNFFNFPTQSNIRL